MKSKITRTSSLALILALAGTYGSVWSQDFRVSNPPVETSVPQYRPGSTGTQLAPPAPLNEKRAARQPQPSDFVDVPPVATAPRDASLHSVPESNEFPLNPVPQPLPARSNQTPVQMEEISQLPTANRAWRSGRSSHAVQPLHAATGIISSAQPATGGEPGATVPGSGTRWLPLWKKTLSKM